MQNTPCLIDPCIMEGYLQYLVNTSKLPLSRAKMYVNKVRKFHNYVGRSYIDIEQSDIQAYLFFLRSNEQLREGTLYSHLAAIKKFYEYLWSRGDSCKIPRYGLNISYRLKENSACKVKKNRNEAM